MLVSNRKGLKMQIYFAFLCCLSFFLNCIDANNTNDIDMFKRAVNRTFIGFEKGNHILFYTNYTKINF